MPSRIATGPTGDPESIKSLIRSDPSAIEPGLCLLDFDSRMGPAGSLDAIGVDQAGRLTIVVVATGDRESALARLLDGHLWAADQIGLLGRLYSDHGVRVDLPVRGLLLSASFDHAFLRRLSLLSVEVVPYLAREVAVADGARLAIIEPAAPLFDVDLELRPRPDPVDRAERARADADLVSPRSAGAGSGGRARADRVGDGRQPFWPEGVLPAEDAVARRGIPVVSDVDEPLGDEVPGEHPLDQESPGVDTEPRGAIPPEEMPWPASPEERFPWDIEAASPADAAAAQLPPIDLEPAAEFETLTAEELDEFERFERHRRGKR